MAFGRGSCYSTSMGARERYHYLDLLRGLAAVTVIIFHYRLFYGQVGNPWRYEISLPLFSLLWPVYDYGTFAVRLFWALSGFVFVAAYGDAKISARTFWVHRFSRLYPLHLVTLLVVAGLQLLSLQIYGRWTVEPHNDIRHFLLQLFMASNWFTASPSFNAPIWSVSIEVLIYFVFLFYLRRIGLNLWVAIALIILGALGSLLLGSLVAQCLSIFFSGVVLAIVTPKIRNLLPLSILAFAGVFASGALLQSLGWGHHIYQMLRYVGSPAVLTFFVALDREAPPLPSRWHWIGLSTYSVYLWHMPLLIAIKIAWGDWIPAFLSNPLALCIWIAVMAAIGVVSYRHFEAPAQTWLRRVLSSRTPRPEAAQPSHTTLG